MSAAPGSAARPPQIVAFGGGGFSMEWGNTLLDDHVLSLTGVARPRVCFLPTASGDADHYVVRFYRAFPSSVCEPSHISLFRRETGRRRPTRAPALPGRDLRRRRLARVADRAPGRRMGSTTRCTTRGRRACVLCGGSAGSLCWFDEVLSGFHEGPQRRLRGLGFLPYSNAVHYNEEPGRRTAFPGRDCRRACRPATGSAMARRCTSSAPSWPRSCPRGRSPRPGMLTLGADGGASPRRICRSATWASRCRCRRSPLCVRALVSVS